MSVSNCNHLTLFLLGQCTGVDDFALDLSQASWQIIKAGSEVLGFRNCLEKKTKLPPQIMKDNDKFNR